MLTDSLYWDVAYADMNQIICESFGAPGSGTFRYKLDTDTIINGTTYKSFKAYLIYSALPQPSPNCPPFAVDTIPINNLWTNNNFLREDTTNQKVYMYTNITASGQEILLYDFDVQVGDTINYPYYGIPFIVDSIYNVTTLDGVSRKYIKSIYQLGPSPLYYIEGLGGCAGVFHEPYDYFENGPWLMCITDIYQNAIWGSGQGSLCSFFATSTNENVYDSNKISFSPNPANGYIKFINIPANSTIEFINNMGKRHSLNAIDMNSTLSIEHIPAGIYFLNVIVKEYSKPIGKLIKL